MNMHSSIDKGDMAVYSYVAVMVGELEAKLPGPQDLHTKGGTVVSDITRH